MATDGKHTANLVGPAAANGLKQGALRLCKRLAYAIATLLLLYVVARIAARIVGVEMVGWFIVIIGPILFGYFVLWPQLNRLVSSVFGFLFWSQIPLEDTPVMSRAQSLRNQERFDEALAEYRKIVSDFPGAKAAHFEMIDMAVRDMKDEDLGRELLLNALTAVDGKADRQELQDCFDCARTVNAEVESPPSRIAFDLDDEDDLPI